MNILEFMRMYDSIIDEGFADPHYYLNRLATREMSVRTGKTLNWVHKMLSRAKSQGLTPKIPGNRAQGISQLKSKISKLEKENHEILHKYNNLSRTLFNVKEGINDNYIINTNQKSKSTKTKSSVTPVTIWSDWHVGEVVDPKQIHNINGYNLSIARNRVNELVNKTITLCFNHVVNPVYEDGIVIFLIGDIVSGDIHEELEKTNEIPVLQTVIEAVNMLTWALKELGKHFCKITVACVPGNHGRLTEKMQAKNFHLENLDWLTYNFLSNNFKDDSKYEFHIPESSSAFVKVENMTFLGMHGCELGVGGGGEAMIGPIGKIIRGEQKVRASFGQVNLEYDVLLLGHFHNTLWLPRVFVNNSLKGYCEYSFRVLKAMPSRPSQSLFFVNSEYGVINKQEIFV